jgi:hypothetical protein
MDCSLSSLAPRFLVSEYQYYDFRALDRPLTRNEMAALRSISTRAAITATSFTNHYKWGDLKANPSKLLEKYFDAFVYVANWGTHEFYIRLPQGSVDYKLLKAMVPGEPLRVRKTATFVIVEFGFESEWDGEDDGTGWMASLMPLRSDLLRGDLRCLYLGWLRCAQDGGLDEGKLEPPVPAGLEELSGPLHALIEFLEIDEDLVEVAAQASKPLAAGPSRRGPAGKELQNRLAAAPEHGDVIPGTGGFRKLRWTDPRRGKGRRGGLRVIYYYFPGEQQIWLPGEQQIWLITLYDKDEASDLTPKERQALKSAIEIELRARQAAKLAKQRKSRR